MIRELKSVYWAKHKSSAHTFRRKSVVHRSLLGVPKDIVTHVNKNLNNVNICKNHVKYRDFQYWNSIYAISTVYLLQFDQFL